MRCSVRFMVAASLLAFSAGAGAQTLTPEQKTFREIYQELVEINTTDSVGDNTQAARAMMARLKSAGYADIDMHLYEALPRKGGLVVRLKGTGARKPILLLAHLDVVEAKREDWESDPFKLREAGGYFTARGSVDDKSSAAEFVSVFAQLKREGYLPDRDLILALTADEESTKTVVVNGVAVTSNGVRWLLKHHRDWIDAAYALNEGDDTFLKNGKPYQLGTQVAEKVYLDLQLEAKDIGGHSSVPTKANPITRLAQALSRLAAFEFPVRLDEARRQFFMKSAQLQNGADAADMKAVAGAVPDADAIARLATRPHFNAQLRTTCVVTEINGGHARNALPQSATANVNCRMLPSETIDATIAEIRRVIADSKVEVKLADKPELSPPSPINPELFGALEKLTSQMWPGVPVIPTMSTGATDSAALRNAGIPSYGVSGIFIDPADDRSHGKDERIGVKELYEGREFMLRLVKSLSGDKAP
jgi:acetylornithine deacetylase/succinyl-diaminopimelate desuccinylase-like protein